MKNFLLTLLSIWLFSPLLSNAQCTITAGSDMTVCASVGSFPIQGTATQFTAYNWTSSGSGSFQSTTTIGTVYTPSAADISAGSVTISITGSGGSCTVKTAMAVITINPSPTINSPTSMAICNGAPTNYSPTSSTPGATFSWTRPAVAGVSNAAGSGTGYISETITNTTNSAVTVTYIITPTAGACVGASQTVSVPVNPAPVVNAGLDQTSCSTTPITVAGASTTGTTSMWSTSGSGSFSNPTVINSTYAPSPADAAAGFVTLTLTSTLNACVSTDQLALNIINSGASVNAGPDQSMCGNNVSVTAVFSGSGGVIWSTTGTGTFTPAATSATVTYSPSQADRTAGAVTLTATTTGNGSCSAAIDQLTVIINARVRLITGPDMTVCPNVPVFPTVSIDAGTVTWTTSGTGSFTNPASLNPVYIPSAADNAAGQFTLTATSSTNGSCPSETGNTKITLTGTTAVANAGPDITVCGTQVSVYGSVTNATGGSWTSSGTGTFAPGSNYLNTTYTLSNADMTNGSVVLTLTTTGTCGTAVADQLTITSTSSSAPMVNAGPDQTLTGASATLTGTSSGTAGIVWSTTGSGTFSTNTALTTIYTPSTADLANGLVTLSLTSTGGGACPAVTDHMYLTTGNAYNLSGVIHTAANLLDKGFVFLFKKDGTKLTFIKADTILTADAGVYSFTDLPSGQYIVLASPSSGSSYVNSFLPTYSGGTQDWLTAHIVSLTGTFSYDLSLSTFTSADPNWNTGADIIAGIIYMTPLSQATAKVEATDVPAPYVTVFL